MIDFVADRIEFVLMLDREYLCSNFNLLDYDGI